MAGRCAKLCSRILFRYGQILLIVGLVLIVIALATSHWVVRESVNWDDIANPNETIVTLRYGIFKACRQKGPDGVRHGGICGAVGDYLNLINHSTVGFVQFLMVASTILFFVGVVVELVQFLPVLKFRNSLAENRVSEAFVSIGAVMMLTGMVIFAGEVKNKAERMIGQDEESTGWSFIICLVGLLVTIHSVILTIMFRELPMDSATDRGGSWVK